MSGDPAAAAAAAIASVDADALVAALVAMPDKRRRELRDELRDELRRRHRLPDAVREWPPPLQTVGLVLDLATSRPGDVAWGWWRLSRDRDERQRQFALAADVLAARPRSAHRALARGVCEVNGGAASAWPVLRELRRRGVVDEDLADRDALAVGVVRAIASLVPDEVVDWRDPPDDVLVRAIRHDPEVADLVLHGLGSRAALDAAHGPWPPWVAAAVAAGALDRDVVLRTVLGTQDGDVRPSTAGLLAKLLAALDPTLDELEGAQRDLVRILSDGHPTARRQAADLLRRLAAADRLADAAAVAGATGPALTGRQKAAAVAACRLLAALPAPGSTLAEAAVAGLGHAHPDVQGRALDLVDQHLAGGPPGQTVAEVAALHVDTVAPEHRDRVVALAGVGDLVVPMDEEAPDLDDARRRARAVSVQVRTILQLDEAMAAADRGEVPGPARFDAADAPPGDPVPPVRDAEELGELLGFLLGGSATSLDLERAIDGIARTDVRTAPPHVTSTLIRLAAQSLQGGGMGGGTVGFLVAQLGHDWAAGRTPSPLEHLRPTRGGGRLARVLRRGDSSDGGLLHDLVRPPRASHDFYAQPDGGAGFAGLLGVVQGRLFEAVTISQAAPRPTLALPTDDRGWIDDAVLVDRIEALAAAGSVPGRFETVAALLRLRAPERLRGGLPRTGPTAAVAAAVDDDRAADPALVRALARTGTEIGALTLAAQEGRPGLVRATPWFAVDEVPPWRRDDVVGQLLDEVRQTESRHAASWWNTARNVLPEADRSMMAWAPLALPWGGHLLAAAATRAVLVDPDADRSSSALDTFVAHAIDPDVPLDHPWHLLLATALLANNRVTGITAADVVAAAAADARLDSVRLGDELARLHAAGVGAVNRTVDRLGPVVETSPVVAAAVRRAVARWVAQVEGLPRDLHHVLGLLELACTHSGAGITDPATRAALEAASTGRSRRATTAARLLAREQTAAAHEPAAALAGHVDRAERWHHAASAGGRR